MPQVQDLDGGGTIGVEEPPEPIRRNAHRIVGKYATSEAERVTLLRMLGLDTDSDVMPPCDEPVGLDRYPARVNVELGTPCARCGRQLRPRNTLREDYEQEYQVHIARGLCFTCHKRATKERDNAR